MVIRPETPADGDAVRRVEERAFGRPDEAALVDALRLNGRVVVALVAEVDGAVVAHILFTPVAIDGTQAVGLAPLAVLPGHQGRGIGAALVRRGLAECRAAGHDCAVVLGEPGYYDRFGFTTAADYGLRCEFDAPPEAFMIVALRDGALAGVGGVARYAPEFGVFA